MLNQLDGKYLYTFLKVYEQRNISRASVILGFSQSTVTNHIQIVENVLNVKLFDRTINGVQPTQKGEIFAKYAYQFYELSEQLNEELNQVGGVIRVRGLESFYVTHFSKPIIQFLEKYPAMEIKLLTGFHQSIIDDVVNQKVDFGIIPFNPQHSKLLFTPLLQEEFVFICSNVITEQKLMSNELRIIGFGSSCIYQSMANNVLLNYGKLDYKNIEYASLDMIKQTVISGTGIALVPKCSIENELNTNQLKILNLGERIFIQHGMIELNSSHAKDTSTLFKTFILENLHA